MTTGEITAAILRDRWKRNFCLPRFTPVGWWECDIFEVTEAGYWREYEVKTSRPDFRKDGKKQRAKRGVVRNKHQLLADRDPVGPNRFWFVCPVGLVALDEVPEWAGLIEVRDIGRGRKSHRLRDAVVKPAPRLHGEKCRPQVAEKARDCCYWRLHAAWGTASAPHEPADYEI